MAGLHPDDTFPVWDSFPVVTRPSFCTTVSERVYITTSWGHASKGGSPVAYGSLRATL